MKKRERTANLINESEVLESQNIDFKAEIRNLENQRRRLMDILQAHSAQCVHQGGYQPLPSVSTLKNCKYLNEVQDYTESEQPEIKYSQTLKDSDLEFVKQHLLQEELEFKPQPMLGYCKPSPTDSTNYVLSPDSGFVRSPVDLDTQYMEIQQQQQQHPAHRSNYIPTSSTTDLTSNNNNNAGEEVTAAAEFILKSELIDSHSPYTSLQSADRFLFESNEFDEKPGMPLPTLQTHNHHHQHHHQHLNTTHHMLMNIKDNQQQQQITSVTNQMLMDGNFDSLKADFLSQNQEFIVLPDGTEPQFTDLDSGIIKSLNNGCLV